MLLAREATFDKDASTHEKARPCASKFIEGGQNL
jgi:hypothetical protein